MGWFDGLGDVFSSLGGLFGGGGSGPSNVGSGEWTSTGAPNWNFTPPIGGGGPVFDPGPEGGGTGTIPGFPRTDGGIPTVYGGGGFDWTKVIPALVPAAGGIIGMLRGQGGSTDAAINAMNKSTKGLQKAGNQALAAYTSGNLTGPQQAKVDAFKQANLAKWRQYLTNAGIPEGSAMADIEAKVNQDATAYAEQLLQQDFQNAYASTGLVSSNLGRVAQMQAMQDAAQRKQWEDFMKAIGGLSTQIPDWFG